MGLVRCERGHYYDARKYARCPQCGIQFPGGAGEAGADDSVTMRLAPEEGSASGREDGEITVRYSGGTPGADAFSGNGPVAGWLVCVSGPARGRDYRIFRGKNHIGRTPDMDICIEEDMRISRDRHCTVVYEERGNVFYLVEGRGLTCRNGRVIGQAEQLMDGDTFEIGGSRLTFVAFCREERVWTDEAGQR